MSCFRVFYSERLDLEEKVKFPMKLVWYKGSSALTRTDSAVHWLWRRYIWALRHGSVWAYGKLDKKMRWL